MGTLLVALAHPDDETFGTGGAMARAVEEGHRVVILCATHGEAGEIADPSLATPETLATVREAELRAAARALGVSEVRFLDHRDSGMAGTPENGHPDALVNAPADAVIAELVAVIREVRPDVVVTFETGGIYGHPDHITISERVTAAVDAAAQPGHDGQPHRVSRLYHIALPKSVVRAFADAAAASGAQWGLGKPEDVERAPEDHEVIGIDVKRWLPRKQAAVAAHATQRGTVEQMPPEFLSQMLAKEWFMLVRGSAEGEKVAGL